LFETRVINLDDYTLKIYFT